MTEAVKRKRAALGLNATVYTPDDLGANEAGYLSEAQIAQLQALAEVRKRSVRGEFVSAGIIVSLIPLTCVLVTLQPATLTSLLVSGLLIVGVVVGAAWLASEINMDTVFSIRYDTERGTVKAGRGRVQTVVVRAPMSSLDSKRPPEMRYYLQINDTMLETDYGTHLSIRPDEDYTVYYTPSSCIAVLVKPATEPPLLAQVDRHLLSRTGSRAAAEEYVQYLHTAFGTTPDDVQQNEAGQLSIGQLTKLQSSVNSKVLLGLLSLGGLIMMGLIWGIAFSTPVQGRAAPDPTQLWSMFLLLAIPILICFVRPTWRFRALWLDLRELQVESVDGRAILTPSRKQLYGYSLLIGGIEFKVDKAQYDLLQHGDPYTVYFTPHSRTLLAIEWLGASPFKPEGSTPSLSH